MEMQPEELGAIEEEMKSLPVPEVMGILTRCNETLAELGVTTSISVIAYGASRYGNSDSAPENFLSALLHSQPELKFRETIELERAISQIAFAAQRLARSGKFQWQKEFTISPRRANSQ